MVMIPGLGADRRMYHTLLKRFPQACVQEFIPHQKGEQLHEYAARYAAQVMLNEKPLVLIGTSLGGIVCMELIPLLNPHAVILINTVKDRNELPRFIRALRFVPLHKTLSGNGYKKLNQYFLSRLSRRRNTPASQLIEAMSRDVNPQFVSWGINAVINWRGSKVQHPRLVHLHGTKDLLFPYSNIRHAQPIHGGSHVMNLTMSKQVDDAVEQALRLLLGG